MKALKINKKLTRRDNNINAYVFLAPYLILFTIFIMIPIAMAIILSATNFNTLKFPDFIGLMNHVNLITQDEIFMQYVLPNTITYALIVGPGGYTLSFLIAWALAQLSKVPRTILALPRS